MAIIDIKIEDRAVRRALTRGAAAVGAALDLALEEGLDGIIADMRRNDPFTNGHGMAGLLGGLWRGDARGGSIEAGWAGPSAVYGPVLEKGPKEKGPKEIRPKNVLTKGYGSTGASGRAKRSAGQPILALRIPISPQGPTQGGSPMAGEVIYRRSSTYLWKPSMLRPHWGPAMKRNGAAFKRLIRARVMAAIGAAMDKGGRYRLGGRWI